jgi:serine/threonine protein kinase/tetratricopeptide (TPR) repeat protein
MIGQTLGHYRILDKLGAGGMGVVYRAYDSKLERTVAIKLVGESISGEPTARERLLREARSAAGLNHPHVCTIHEVGEADGQVYVVMEHVEGRPLSALLAESRATESVVRYGIQIADALAHAHQNGIVHRDLKTGNVLVTPEGRVKVLDFGLAKRLRPEGLSEQETRPTDSLTAVGQVVGTLHYLAPEVLRGKAADARTDIWALGVLLYELATGQLPFQGKTRFEVTNAILSEAPRPWPPVPVGLQVVIGHCLSKEPGERYQAASEVRAALDAVQSGTVPLPATAGARRRGWKVGVVAGLLAFLVAGGAYRWWESRTPGIASIAVLPFTNVGGNPDDEYLSDGIAENVIGSLSELRGLKVIAFSSVTSYKGRDIDTRKVGGALGVEALVTGRVEQRGDVLAIRAVLVRVADGRELWGQRFTGTTRGLVSLQNDLAGEIIGNLRPEGTGEERKRARERGTDNSEAYQLFLKGEYYHQKEFTLEDYSKALDYYLQAIDKDPNYARAYGGLADLYGSMAFSGAMPTGEAHDKARAAVDRATALNESDYAVQLSRAVFSWSFAWDWSQAEQSCQRAMELNPNFAGAYFFCGQCSRALGRFEEAVLRMRKSEELSPLSVDWSRGLATTYYWAHRYDEAIAQARKTLALAPKDAQTHELLADVYGHKGLEKEAIAEQQQTLALGGDPEGAEAFGQDFESFGYERALRQLNLGTLSGLNTQAERGWVSPVYFVMVYAKLGDSDEAFVWLNKALDERAPWLTNLKTDPAFDALRSDPRFAPLLKKIGLP